MYILHSIVRVRVTETGLFLSQLGRGGGGHIFGLLTVTVVLVTVKRNDATTRRSIAMATTAGTDGSRPWSCTASSWAQQRA